jgi:predicted O-methyltransferase YrrM
MQMPKIFKPIAVGAIALSMGIIGCTPQTEINAQTTQTAPPAGQTEQREPDVPYVPTPQEVVDEMLKLAKVQKGDVLYDLGSGDGRIPITAVKSYGVQKAVGIDINPERIKEANANAKTAGVSDRVQFLNQDLFKSNFSEASVVTLYLLPDINVKLRPQLFKQLKPGTRIVSHDFDMGEWKPDRVVQVQGPNRTHTLYYWVVPKEPPANLD